VRRLVDVECGACIVVHVPFANVILEYACVECGGGGHESLCTL
jgi:hypothetical protein